MFPRHPANDSSKLHQFVCYTSFLCFKLYSWDFANAHGHKRIYIHYQEGMSPEMLQQNSDLHFKSSLIKFQVWQFSENPTFQNLFSKQSKHICDKPLQSDLVSKGYCMRFLLYEISVQIEYLNKVDHCHM